MTVTHPQAFWAFVVMAVSFGFSAGAFVEHQQCANDIAVLRAQFQAHERLLIHPGAATSEVVKALEQRVHELEQRVGGR